MSARDRLQTWKRSLVYGALLAAGVFALQWLDYLRLVRANGEGIATLLIAAGFLGLGVYVGVKVIGGARAMPFDGNAKVVTTLGISPRELAVLQALAAGLANKEIAGALGISPNTVKTHVARLYEKLDVRRRTEAIARARELGILP